jgi:hypothetical protein
MQQSDKHAQRRYRGEMRARVVVPVTSLHCPRPPSQRPVEVSSASSTLSPGFTSNRG